MNLRHAAALALVGWYLMTPLAQKSVKSEASAPISTWTIILSYDTAAACESDRARDLKAEMNQRFKEVCAAIGIDNFRCKVAMAGATEQCIATDDPRLKEK